MEIFKTKKPCLILLLLIFHSPFLYPGEALSPAETTEESTPRRQAPAGENTPLLASFPFQIPATDNYPTIGPSFNNQGLQPQTVFPPQQQSLNQPLSGFAQPLAAANQPFLGVNQQPFGVSNQQGLADNTNTLLDSGVSKMNSFTIAIALASLFTLLANLGFIF